MGKGWDKRFTGSGGALASSQHTKGHHNTPRDEVTQGWERWYHTGRRSGEPETRDKKLLRTNRGDGRQVEGFRGGEWMRVEEAVEWIR